MRFSITTFLLLFSTFLFAQIPKVLIIGIDGCRSDALEEANTPNIDVLMANGTFSFDALNTEVTSSGPGWSAMLTGVWSGKHGVIDNTFAGSNYDNFPHFIQRVEEHNANLNTASIAHWHPINDLILNGDADFSLNVNTDNDVATEAINYLANNDPDVLFLHFDDCDGVGHSSGFTPSNTTYLNVIETTDNFIGTVMTALQNRPNYTNEDWLILISTDHGGNGTVHGGNSLGEQRIFFIASGDKIPNQEIEKSCRLQPLNGNCLATTTQLRFDGDNDFIELPNNGLFDFGATQDFTIECRIRTTQGADVAIIGNKDWNSGLNKGVVFSMKYPSGPQWKVNIGDGINRVDLDGINPINDNQWHTLTVTFDRDGDMRMYEDGNFVTAASIATIGDLNGSPIRLGNDVFGNYDFEGNIAEVRIWDTVLDASTIANWHCTHIDNSHPNYANLLGYWQMNEGNGATQINDLSTNANHATINAATWEASNSDCLNLNEVLYFEGTDYVEIANSAPFNFGTNQDFSIECRIRTTQANDVAILGNKNWASGLNTGYVFSFNPSSAAWKVNLGDGTNRVDLDGTSTVADGNWHTLTATFDRDGDLRIYEDGVFIASTSMSTIGNIDAGFPLRFGADVLSGFGYTGNIAEVRVWNTILDATTINTWHCSVIENTHPNYANLLGYWQMNDGMGTIQIQDFSPQNNMGTVNGASWIDPSLEEVCDFTMTPRIVDVAATALAHLCIPINPIWGFDGVPRYSSCPIFIADCIENQFVLPYIYQNQYHAIEGVISNAHISGSSVIFRAGDFIQLESDFEVELGNEFDAQIVPCN